MLGTDDGPVGAREEPRQAQDPEEPGEPEAVGIRGRRGQPVEALGGRELQRLVNRAPHLLGQDAGIECLAWRAAVELLERHDNLFATITLHHLLITLDDVAGETVAGPAFKKITEFALTNLRIAPG